METTKQKQPVTDQDKFVRGLYRNIGELARSVKLLAIALERSFGPVSVEVKNGKPVQADLPGIAPHDTADLPSGLAWVNEHGFAYKPGDIAKQIAKKPRTWCNTVKVWDAIWDLFGRDGMPITKQELYTSEELPKEIGWKTNNKVGIESLSKILSVLVRAGAMERLGRDAYHSEKPTDELREAVERVAKKRKEVAA